MNVKDVTARLSVRDFTGETDVLAGARFGAQLFAALAGAMPASSDCGAPLFIDFTDVQFATASFLRESVLPLKSLARTVRSSWYPVVANAAPTVLEELEVVCAARFDAILACILTPEGEVSDIRLVGALDQKQREAYDFVTANGCSTAKTLMAATARDTDAHISPTAWNNRLSALVEKGIVSEGSEGRHKLYTPILRNQ